MMVDGFLIAVTVFSLVLATVMAVLTWRLYRMGRRQEAAPVAAPPAPSWPPARRAEAAPIERPHRQVADRVPAAGSDAAWNDIVLSRTLQPGRNTGTATRQAASKQEVKAEVLPARRTNTGGQREFAVGAGIATIVLMIALGSVLIFTTRSAGTASASTGTTRGSSPLELVALDYARDGANLTIRGLVRNPLAGSEMRQLQAVAFLFDSRGEFLGTTRTSVADGTLRPGTECSFEIPVKSGLRVSRYRVSFRVATAPVPHIDRRAVSTPAVPTPAPVPAPAPPTAPNKPGSGERAAQMLSVSTAD